MTDENNRLTDNEMEHILGLDTIKKACSQSEFPTTTRDFVCINAQKGSGQIPLCKNSASRNEAFVCPLYTYLRHKEQEINLDLQPEYEI